MIVGLGTDVVDVERFQRAIERTPALAARLFAPEELVRDGRARSATSLAARFAAKEAAQKALGTTPGMRWIDTVVRSEADGAPTIELRGAARSRAAAIGAARIHLSMSHDAGLAVATVIAES